MPGQSRPRRLQENELNFFGSRSCHWITQMEKKKNKNINWKDPQLSIDPGLCNRSYGQSLPALPSTWNKLTFLVAQIVKNLPALWETQLQSLSWEDPGEGNGNPLQYSCLENAMDRGACQATFHGVAKCRTWLSDWNELKVYVFIIK